jgi:hypothetical protein
VIEDIETRFHETQSYQWLPLNVLRENSIVLWAMVYASSVILRAVMRVGVRQYLRLPRACRKHRLTRRHLQVRLGQEQINRKNNGNRGKISVIEDILDAGMPPVAKRQAFPDASHLLVFLYLPSFNPILVHTFRNSRHDACRHYTLATPRHFTGKSFEI